MQEAYKPVTHKQHQEKLLKSKRERDKDHEEIHKFLKKNPHRLGLRL